MSALLDAALSLAADGWRVFPLRPRGKTPLTAHGFQDATTDERRIRQWWRSTPDANVGLALPQGVVVVDIDGPTDLSFPETLTARTARGEHRYYRTDTTVTQRKLAANVDLRVGGKGYVVAPPSIHESGVEYQWISKTPIHDLPGWVVKHQVEAPKERTAHLDVEPIPKGERNETLARLAGGLRSVGLHPNEIHAALVKVNDQRCEPPLAADEVARIALSSVHWEPGQLPSPIKVEVVKR